MTPTGPIDLRRVPAAGPRPGIAGHRAQLDLRPAAGRGRGHRRSDRTRHDLGPALVERTDQGPMAHAASIALPADDELDDLVRRWLSPTERTRAAARHGRGRRSFVAGRVAATRAVQAHLASLGFAPIAADRIDVGNDEAGCPVVAVRGARVSTRDLRVSIAHGGAAAVAVASTRRAASGSGTGLGIDVEPVEARSAAFERLALAAREQELVAVAGDDRDTWLTRLWSAKEAAAKATGRGLRGRPKAFVVEEVAGERMLLAGRWIRTELVTFSGTPHVVAITEPRTERAWHRS